MSTKTIAIVGITGNQGSSTAEVFLKDPAYKIRGLTRDPSKPAAKAWTDRGVEVVQADINDPATLKAAFKGASVIFAMTDFWSFIKDPAVHAEAAQRNITPNEIAYEREIQHGKNLIDAAATIDGLELFILSTLSDSKGWSKGKITFNLHFDAKWAAVEYLKAEKKELWKKTSLLEMGLFAQNWKEGAAPRKVDGQDGYVLTIPMSGTSKFPYVDVVADTGSFVKALALSPPQTHLVGAGSFINWNEWVDIWAKHNNVSCTFVKQDRKQVEEMMGSVGRELADMFEYIDEFGYDGRNPAVVYPWDLKKKGVEVSWTTAEEYIKNTDWSVVLTGGGKDAAEYGK